MNKFAHYKSSGFTLVELLLVVSIIALLSGFMIPSFNSYIRNQNLRQSQEQVKTDLRSVQNRALSGVSSDSSASHWGLKFVSGAKRYSFFLAEGVADAQCDNAVALSTSSSLPGDVVLRNGGCMFFSFDNGNVNFSSGFTEVILGTPDASGNRCSRVSISNVGLIQEEGNAACSN